MKTFWTLWEDLNNAANQPASQNDTNPEKKKEFKQLELLPTKDFDVREKARKEVGDGFNILKDNVPGPLRKRMEADLAGDDLDTIYGVGEQMGSLRLQHPLMDVINDRGRGKDSEVLKRFNKIQDLKQQGGSKKDLSPFFKMKQELKGGADGFAEKMMEQFPNIDVSQSSEMLADMRGEDGLQSNDILHQFLPEISEAMGDMPANIQDQFSKYLQNIQYRYKTGGDYDSLIDELLDVGFDEGDQFSDGNREFNGINTKWGVDDVDEGIKYLDDRLEGDPAEVSWGNIIPPKKIEALKGQGGTAEQIISGLLKSDDQDMEQRMMFLMNKFADKSGNSLEDILGNDEGIQGLSDFIKSYTPLDARRTWNQQILPSFEDGKVFRNEPASGGRGGNVRERLYKRMGFGELQSDDYQYGAKDGDKLQPLGEDEIDTFNASDFRDYQLDVGEMVHENDYFSNFTWEDVENYADVSSLSDEDLREIARDPYEFAQEMYRSARSQYVEDTPYDDHVELKSTLSRSPALERKFEDDEEIDEFDEFIANVWENMDVEEKETLLMASEYGGDRGDVDEWAEFLYNEYIANKEED